MKTIYLILFFLAFFIPFNSQAQYGTILPDGFIIPKSAMPPGCTVNDDVMAPPGNQHPRNGLPPLLNLMTFISTEAL